MIALRHVAVRELLRHRLRTALLLAVIAVPVMAIVSGLVLFSSAIPNREQRLSSWFTSADMRVVIAPSTASQDFEALLPPPARALALREASAVVELPGDRVQFLLSDLPLADEFAQDRLVLRSGAAPQVVGDVALSRSLMKRLQVNVGDTFDLSAPATSVRVVGEIANPIELDRFEAVATTETLALAAGDGQTWLVDSGPVDPRFVEGHLRKVVQSGLDIYTREGLLKTLKRDSRPDMTLLAGAACLGMSGLIAASAFAVSARRNQYSFATLLAAGAEPRHIRRIVLLQGLVVGAAAAFAGAVGGLLLAAIAMPFLAEWANRAQVSLAVPVGRVAVVVGLSTVTAVGAALVPAIRAARATVAASLGERAPKVPRRITSIGSVVLLSSGIGWIWLGSQVTDSPNRALISGGVIAALLGGSLSSGVAVRALARVSGRLPTLPRIAARDLARSPGRVLPTTAAIISAWAFAIGAVTVVASHERFIRSEYVPTLREDQLLIEALGRPATEEEIASVAAAVKRSIPGSSFAPVRIASTAAGDRASWVVATGAQQSGEPRRGLVAEASDELLDALAVSVDAKALLAEGAIVGLGPNTVGAEGVKLRVPDSGLPIERQDRTLQSRGVSLTSAQPYAGLPLFLASPETLRQLGLHTSFESYLVRSPRALDTAAVRTAREAVPVGSGIYVTEEEAPATDSRFRQVLGVIAAMFSIAIAGFSSTLAMSESQRELALLQVIGASQRTSRTYAATQGALLAAVAVSMAVPIGLLASAAGLISHGKYPIVIPALPLLAGTLAIIAVPAVAAFVLQRGQTSDVRGGLAAL